ncbi:non-ribosomal peptide synthetase-like protein [Terracoccus luteus]|uniref:Non-ribosomal peptide synthetase-like protein n=1 Tax=Terracoccus luteus TaxID=53356 RepID=A0A495XSN6_9MICO|nr:Pls/PosA family non-ribosomal peptide synthetase [Terracoccus luteus]RKT77551.1 non-ribosomal peptide synthetase-like protein [Terracoccus luteus]
MTDPLLAAERAAAPRTLVDVLAATVAAHPDAPALDDTRSVLTYAELAEHVEAMASALLAAGVRPGDTVGVRAPSGTHDLYVSILGILRAGAAYVPVDADDPQERADLVFGEARVSAVVTAGRTIERTNTRTGTGTGTETGEPLDAATEPAAPALPDVQPADDAWVIFTSGSTGVPKGVAVTHRSAAAFVDAEARIFLQDSPIGPDDRVLAGLSVAFDASCEEMWLAWAHGACLVPAPRALVRTGMDLGPWLVAQGITVVSTVPTLAALWPVEALEPVRLLIFGGEACPPDIVARLATPEREVWNTYGPTEATVVACAAVMTGDGPVRIGLPLDGWDLVVVGEDERPVEPGATGQLIIGGVGLARYLDPAKDAEKFAPMPTLGWERAYRSGDLVVNDPDGLVFVGRADEQVKLGGRRIELGEVDAALQGLPTVTGAAAAVKTTPSGTQVLVGYVVPVDPSTFDAADATARLRDELPAALVPLLAVVAELPTRTSGKVDRAALPWPLPGAAGGADDGDDDALTGTEGWLAEQWTSVLGARVTSADADFFSLGGGSLSAAQLVSLLRRRAPTVTVADLYDRPRLAAQAELVEASQPREGEGAPTRHVRRIPRRTQLVQTVVSLVLLTVKGLQWVVALVTATELLRLLDLAPWARPTSWWVLAVGWVAFVTPVGRMSLSALGARILLHGVRPGTYPRGGRVQLRLWAAERLTEALGAVSMAGAPWILVYARALGARVGRGVDLHSVPPVTGMLTLGDGASIEPEVDLSGYWMDGDVVHVGAIHVGAGASVGARSTIGPDVRIGRGALVEAGSTVLSDVSGATTVAGSPARRVGGGGSGSGRWPSERPSRRVAWVPVYGVSSVGLALVPLLSLLPALLVLAPMLRGATSYADAAGTLYAAVPLVTVLAFLTLALVTVVVVRLLGLGLSEGFHPVRGRVGWQVWMTERLLDQARTMLFPVYASLATPTWLRLLGARIGKDVEASTVLLLPRMTTVADGAFLADDTLVAGYELGRGWMRIERAKIGKRAFLGNSGMTAPGRRVPKNGLVAVLSAAPQKSKAGSSWLGSPPVRLRRAAQGGDDERTFAPPTRLKVLRGLVELCRIVPVMVTVALGVTVLVALAWVVDRMGLVVAALLSGVVLAAVGAVAAAVTTAAKWAVVGPIRAVEHPLWSSFVWRNEVVDTFVEMVAGPWFAWTATGTPAINVWLRTLGARIGHGVWCETYWLPEADLVTLGDGVTVNRGCVLQTHLFHDRIMAMDAVTLGQGATLGPNGVILPAAAIEQGATVGPGSLVLRGESVPPGSRWTGNPIAPWPLDATATTTASDPGVGALGGRSPDGRATDVGAVR